MKNVLLILLAVFAISCSDTKALDERNRIFEKTEFFLVYETKDSVTYIGVRDCEKLLLPCNYVEQKQVNKNTIELKHKNGQLVYLTKEKDVFLAYNKNIPLEKNSTYNPPLFWHTGILMFICGMLLVTIILIIFLEDSAFFKMMFVCLCVTTIIMGVAHPYNKISENYLGYQRIEEQSKFGLADDRGEISLKKEYAYINYFSNDFMFASKASGAEDYIHFFLDKDLRHYVIIHNVSENSQSDYAYNYRIFVFGYYDCGGMMIVSMIFGAMLAIIVLCIRMIIKSRKA